jgi:enoyl reductase-like protein
MFCIAIGIPTTEKVAEIMGGLKSIGIYHVAFKPGIMSVAHTIAASKGHTQKPTKSTKPGPKA